MRWYLIILQLLICFGCEKSIPVFETVPCNPDDISLNFNLQKIYKPCRQFIYSVHYWHDNQQLISEEYIWLMATGRDWDYLPERQDEIIIQYHFDSTKIKFINQFNPNVAFRNKSWEKMEITGIIETEQQTWTHPFRANQYVFTETVAFPMVKFPMEIEKTWTSDLNIYDHWGDWSNSTIHHDYKVIDHKIISIPFNKMKAWHIEATSTAPFGISTNNFWYNEDYGFIKMDIINYKNQRLSLELVSVIE